mmetsp:Transcript_18177/g.15847  ORF Transcript_18177/g.15847 Transcript_18177/m.15847 type:complete len:392 (-) Transcript_18177:718-1893(-)
MSPVTKEVISQSMMNPITWQDLEQISQHISSISILTQAGQSISINTVLSLTIIMLAFLLGNITSRRVASIEVANIGLHDFLVTNHPLSKIFDAFRVKIIKLILRQEIISQVPFNGASCVLVPLVKIKSILVIIDDNISIRIHFKYSKRWLQVREGGNRGSNKRGCNGSLLFVAMVNFNLILVGVTIEDTSNSSRVSVDQSTKSRSPVGVTEGVARWDVANNENTLFVVFGILEFIFKPFEHFLWVFRILEEIEVEEITSLGIECDHLEVLVLVVFGIISIGSEFCVSFSREPCLPSIRKGLSHPLSLVVNNIALIAREAFVVTEHGKDGSIRHIFLDFISGVKSLIKLCGFLLLPNIMTVIITSPNNKIIIDILGNKFQELINSSCWHITF